MNAAERYLDAAADAVRSLRTRLDAIDAAARLMADSVAQGGIVHVAGSGHSQLVALELAVRAGGLACIQAIADPALSPTGGGPAAHLERLSGYATAVIDASGCEPGEVLVVVSHSGINPVPIELAVEGAHRGLHVVAVTSLAHSLGVASRHASGRRLAELAEVVIDTGAPSGDVTLQVDGAGIGPQSTALSMTVLHAVMCRVAELLADRGVEVPALVSQNLTAGPDVNAARLARYAPRVRWSR